MTVIYKRRQRLLKRGGETCFLWGARQTGKSTLLRELFPDSPWYDLLLSDKLLRLNIKPSTLREELLANPPGGPVIIDEIQKIPALLDEVQWLIVNKQMQFVLCGSSARKLKRSGGNLLGGRALRYELFPLIYEEVPDFDLIRALNNGLVPRHYLSNNPRQLLESYVADYLRQEIAQEAITRNIPGFSRFLESAVFSNGEIINYQNIARECGVSAPTVKEYFQILVDTLVARFIPSYRRRPKRRVITAPKFFLFDVGLANFLLKRGRIEPRSESFGKAFEHFILQELVAHSHYSGLSYDISYWRTASQLEIDFILGEHEVALQVKGVEYVLDHHLRGLVAFDEEYRTKHSIIVSMDPKPRQVGRITIMPWKIFLNRLWGDEIL